MRTKESEPVREKKTTVEKNIIILVMTHRCNVFLANNQSSFIKVLIPIQGSTMNCTETVYESILT